VVKNSGTKGYRSRDGGISDALMGSLFVWFVFFVVQIRRVDVFIGVGFFNHERHEISVAFVVTNSGTEPGGLTTDYTDTNRI